MRSRPTSILFCILTLFALLLHTGCGRSEAMPPEALPPEALPQEEPILEETESVPETVNVEIICPEGQILEGGLCVVPIPVCPEGQVLQGNECVTPDTTTTLVIPPPTCSQGQVLQNGVCVILAPTCAEGQILRDGQCVVQTLSCPEGQILQNGECVAQPPVCSAGQVFQNGACVTPVPTCTEGQMLQNGRCASQPVTCSQGQTLLSNGRCGSQILGGGQRMVFCAAAWQMPNASRTACIPNPDYVVNFTDPILRTAVRETLDIPDGAEVTLGHLETLTELHAQNDFDTPEAEKISDLTGLEHCHALTVLTLENHQISDISPLAGLTNLARLNLEGNQVANLRPLSNLVNLEELALTDNPINLIAPLLQLVQGGGLRDGGTLWLSHNSTLVNLIPNRATLQQLAQAGVQIHLICPNGNEAVGTSCAPQTRVNLDTSLNRNKDAMTQRSAKITAPPPTPNKTAPPSETTGKTTPSTKK